MTLAFDPEMSPIAFHQRIEALAFHYHIFNQVVPVIELDALYFKVCRWSSLQLASHPY